MSDYKCRGMIKWQPFSALEGHDEYIKSLITELSKVEQPTLSESHLDELDKTIKKLITSNEEALFKYYENGFIKVHVGKPIEVSMLDKTIRFKSFSLNIDAILDIIIK